MIVGVGVDSVAIERCIPWIGTDRARLARLFSPDEISYIFAIPAKSAERMAVRFAAKEAFFKALSAAVANHGLPFLTVCRYVSVVRTERGAPYLQIDQALWGNQAQQNLRVHISLTHTQTTATAFVIIEK